MPCVANVKPYDEFSRSIGIVRYIPWPWSGVKRRVISSSEWSGFIKLS